MGVVREEINYILGWNWKYPAQYQSIFRNQAAMCLPGGKIRTLRKHSAQYPFKLPRYTFTSHQLIMPLDQGVMISKKRLKLSCRTFHLSIRWMAFKNRNTIVLAVFKVHSDAGGQAGWGKISSIAEEKIYTSLYSLTILFIKYWPNI